MARVIRKMALLVCALLLIGAAGFMRTEAAPAKATVYRNQLVRKKIAGTSPAEYQYYYYDKNGRKVTSAWKTLKVKGKTYKYYFGRNGAAFRARRDSIFKYNLVVKKIGKYKYGFDTEGHMVTGLYLTPGFEKAKFYYFKSDGRLHAAATSAIRKAVRAGADSAKLRKLIKKYAGKAKKSYKSGACDFSKGVQPLYTRVLQYTRFEIQYYRMPGNKEIVYIAIGRMWD